MEAANLLLNAAVLGASTSSGAGSGKAADSGSGDGSEFQELVAKMLGDCGIGANVDEVKAGQQSLEGQSDTETEDGQKFAEGIAQAECLLGSIGVILEATEKASEEIATTSSPVQLNGTSISSATTTEQVSANVADGTMPVTADRAESLVQTENVDPSVVKNEVMDAVSEAQPNASTQGAASMTVVQEQPESTISVESGKSADSAKAEETAISDKAGLQEKQVKSDAKTDFVDVKTVSADEKQTAEAANQAVGTALSAEPKTGKATEPESADQSQGLVNDARATADGSSRILGQAQAAAHAPVDQTANTVRNNQQIAFGQTTESGAGVSIDLPRVEEAKNVRDIGDSKPDNSAGVVPPQVADIPGFRAADAVQKSEGNLPPEQVVSAKVIHQIVKAAKVNITEGRSDIVLRLDPPHLGTVNMNVSVADGTVTATIQTSTETARQVLQSDLATLKQSLSDAGINVDQINVSVGGNPNQSQGWNLNSGSQDWTAGGRANGGSWYGNASQDTEQAVDTAGITMQTSSGRLDFLA